MGWKTNRDPLCWGRSGREGVFPLRSYGVGSSASSWAANSLQRGPGLTQHARVPQDGEALGFPGSV